MKFPSAAWLKLPLELRQRYWRETDYGKYSYKGSSELYWAIYTFLTRGLQIHTQEACILFSCQWWDDRTPRYPHLVLREPYWVCPFCNGSYGTEPGNHDPFIADSVP